jgi:hypothetical protein
MSKRVLIRLRQRAGELLLSVDKVAIRRATPADARLSPEQTFREPC